LCHAERRKLGLGAKPTRGHEVLSEVARKWDQTRKSVKGKDMLVLTQNIDGKWKITY
jgi:NAD-dependent SIR2 family protein deacetylase